MPATADRKMPRFESFGVTICAESKIDAMPDGSCIVRDCKVNSNHSQNGTLYPDPVLKEATPLYEGVKVFDNHSDDPMGWMMAPRQRGSVMGRLMSVRWPMEGGGHRADFHVLPSWVDKGLVKDIKADPKAFGFSHVAWCEVADKPTDTGQEVVTKITKVESVDLVSTPATTRGMFENVRRGHGGPLNDESKKEMDPMDATAYQKLIESLEGKVKEKDGQIAGLTSERDTLKATNAGLTATCEDLKKKLQTSEDARGAAEGKVKDAKVEAALTGLPEAVAKSLREAVKPLPESAALAVIESTKAAQPQTKEPAKPRSEGREPAGGETGKTEAAQSITDDAFLSAVRAG